MALELGHALDHVGNLVAEKLGDALSADQGVFDDVVEQARADGHDVQLHVRKEVRNLKRVNEIGLTGMAYLPLVLLGGELVRPADQLEVRLRAVRAQLLEQRFETNHDDRCLTF